MGFPSTAAACSQAFNPPRANPCLVSIYYPDGQLAVKRSESHAANATDEFQKISNSFASASGEAVSASAPAVSSVPSVGRCWKLQCRPRRVGASMHRK